VTTGDITGTNIYGDGSNLTNIGAAAASALTISGKAAENISEGQAVYISGAVGGNVQVSLCDNTINGKGDVIGLAVSTQTTGQTILIRVAGQLDNINTSAWSDGDKLYLSTSGNLVNSAPTTGAIIHIGDVEYSHAINGDIMIHIKRTRNRAVPAGQDQFTRLGDNAGVNKISYKDYANNEVAAIDSNGNITMSGTVDGIDIATDVANNTTHRGLTNPHIDWTADQGATNINAGNYTNTTYSASDFSHNSLSGLNDGDSYEHITQTQKTALHTQNTDTALGSGAVAADHGTAATDQIINVCYGTGTPPTANTTTIGTLFVKYTA